MTGPVTQVETCYDCKQALPVIAAFSARQGHCEAHDKRDIHCSACRAVRHSSKRQPRCKPCNRPRCKRYRRVKKMQGLVLEHGLDENTVRNTDGSCQIVALSGLRQAADPVGLLAELQALAGDLIVLERESALLPTRRDLQTALAIHQLLAARPSGPAGLTFAPYFDLYASAGRLDTPSLPDPAGWLDVGSPVEPHQFVIGVTGDSMVPLIPDGARCLFEEVEFDDSLHNHVVLAQLPEEFGEDGEGCYTVKRLRLLRRRRRLVLMPENERYEPIEVRRGDRVNILAVYRRQVLVA